MNKSQELSAHNKPDFWKTKNNQFDGIAPIDHLFNRFDGIYVGKWRSSFPSDASIRNWRDAWAEAIVEGGLMPEEIKNGIRECRRLHDWPPSFTMFFKACRPSIDYETAYIEAVEQIRKRVENKDVWTDAKIYWAAKSLGNDLNNFPYNSIKSRWKSALDTSRKLVNDGELPNEVPERKIELPAPGRTVTKEVAAKNLAVINKMLSKKIISSKEAA